MAVDKDKKITDLDSLISVDDGDVFVVVDISEPETKKISAEDLFASPRPIGKTTASTGEFTTLQVASGSTVNKFSTDGTLVGNSNTALPTERAVKTYVDSALSGTSGTSGTSGVSGTSGTSGSSGISGTSGTSGSSGASGTSGTSGISGTSGSSGASGTSGTSGTSGGGINWRGAWQDGTSYIVNDIIQLNSVSYIAIVDNVASSSNEPGVGGSWQTYWDVFTEPSGVDQGVINLSSGDTTAYVTLNFPRENNEYKVSVSFTNNVDSIPSIYSYVVRNKTTTGFEVIFSGVINSNNYILEWITTLPNISSFTTLSGWQLINEWSLDSSSLSVTEIVSNTDRLLITTQLSEGYLDIRFNGDSTSYIQGTIIQNGNVVSGGHTTTNGITAGYSLGEASDEIKIFLNTGATRKAFKNSVLYNSSDDDLDLLTAVYKWTDSSSIITSISLISQMNITGTIQIYKWVKINN